MLLLIDNYDSFTSTLSSPLVSLAAGSLLSEMTKSRLMKSLR